VLVLLPARFQFGRETDRQIVHQRLEFVEDLDSSCLLLKGGTGTGYFSNIGLRNEVTDA
jgi:hypothetical protein